MIFTLREDVVWREKENVCIVLNTSTGSYFTLNLVGTLLWKGLIGQQKSLDAIVDELSSLTGAPGKEQVTTDCRILVETWLDESLIK